jgi:hypothetical protein
MRPPTKNHIELSDLEGYKGSILLLNAKNKALTFDIEIYEGGVMWMSLALQHDGAYVDLENTFSLPDAITKYNELK